MVEMTEEPDPRVRDYFVAVQRDDGDYRLLAGPWPDHASALAEVERVRHWAHEYDARAWFYAYGTASLPLGSGKRGAFNKELGLEAAA